VGKKESWLSVGEDLENHHQEHLLAIDCFEQFLKGASLTGEIYSLDPSCLIMIGKSYASIRDFKTAIKLGEIGLENDHFNREVRGSLREWTDKYKRLFDMEERAVSTIEWLWKCRVWSSSFRRKYQFHMMKEWEEQLKENYFDMEVRHNLAYFAKNKWRALFVYEEECAIVIQRAVRCLQMRWRWSFAQRSKYLHLASDLYHQCKRNPYLPKIRQEILTLSKHKYAPKSHIIMSLPLIFEEQERKARVIQGLGRAYVSRTKFKDLLKNHRRKMFHLRF